MAEIKNLEKAAERIKKAIKNKEKIILYGDADLDGVTSVIILRDALWNLGGKIAAVYFFDREIEGYGISEMGLNFLKNKAPALLVSLDCGISNFKEVKLAKKLGFEVIIIDHHQVLDRLPTASIIVNPKQKGDKYPFKELAAAGIAFKLSQILLGTRLTETLRKNFLELVALATIADMMPQKEENEVFIEEGLSSLENSWRPGIKTFFEMELLKPFSFIQTEAKEREEDLASLMSETKAGKNQKVYKIISILNIRDLENQLPASFRVLTISSQEEAKEIIVKLIAKSEIRREKIKETLEEIEELVSKKTEPIVFEGSSDWEFPLISSVASIICQKYQKPTFVFKKLERESQGTVRTPLGIDSVSLMKKCSKYLLTYGGHSLASGFRIKNENLEKFKECLIKFLNI